MKKSFSSQYTLSLIDNSLSNPFSLPVDLLSHLDTLAKKTHSRLDVSYNPSYTLAKELFLFFQQHVRYGDSRRPRGYANAKEVWRNKEGVCGEMSFLYIASARYLGLKSSYVSVTTDHLEKKVHHACAAIWLPERVLVDIAYNTFNIHHRKIEVLSDRDVLNRYESWRLQ